MSALKTRFSGDRGVLFQIALKAGLLTALTLGIYRFWRIARLRRYYWSAVRPGGHPLEYTGTGIEKLAGFCIAVIILAVILLLVNMASIGAMIGLAEALPWWMATGVSFAPLVLIPLIYMAKYRMRAYMVSRTRWRGIRFGMSKGAWGYAWRACMYWLLSIMTFGLLWPLKTYQLEKYLTDRTWYGTARFTQFGGPFSLYGLFAAVPLAFIAGIAAIGWGVYSAGLTGMADLTAASELTFEAEQIVCFVMGGFFLLCSALFFINFNVAAVGLLASMKVLGDGVEFDLRPRVGKVISIYVFGNLISSILISLVSPVILGLVLLPLVFSGKVDPGLLFNQPANIAALIAVLTWVTVFILYGVFREAFITFPLFKHVSQTFEIHEAELLETIRQRDNDAGREAGGFADALDVGAAF